MKNSLYEPRIKNVIDELAHDAEATDPAVLGKVKDDLRARNAPLDDSDPKVAAFLRDAYIPVSLEAGRLLYILARSHGAKRIVEFGTSFGISAIHLGAAARDVGGRVVTTEYEPTKVAAARANIARAGLADVVEVREGDARETLRDLDGDVDLLFLDGWKALYKPVLDVVEPRLRDGALVIADDLDIARAAMKPFLDHVRDPKNGYVSVETPLGDAMELSVRVSSGLRP